MKYITSSKYRSCSPIAKYQKGVTMIEYALIASLIAVVAVLAIGTLGNNINLIWSNIITNM
jgi:pilus assembly protein Flp/PilA